MIDKEVLSWERFGAASRVLALMVADDGFRPDVIVSIARGGLLAAGALGYALDVKNVHVMNILFYTGIGEHLDLPVVLPPVPDAADLSGANVLVVDDVADTGATLTVVLDYYAGHVAAARCAVLYEKPQSIVKCEYVWARTDKWVDFPWSSQAPVIPASRSAELPAAAPQ